jgi:hypothetical protein
MLAQQEYPVPTVKTYLEIAAMFATPSVAFVFMWWSWIRGRAARPATRPQGRALVLSALLVTASNALLWILAVHLSLPGPKVASLDVFPLGGLITAMLGIIVALFGKGRRTVALTVTAGVAAFAFWALCFCFSSSI